MTIKKVLLPMLLLSSLASKNATAMQNVERIIRLSEEELLEFKKKGEHPFIIVNNTKNYAYPDPNHDTYKSDPILFSHVFMYSLNMNLDWRKQNGHSDYETTHYHKGQIKALDELRQQINQGLSTPIEPIQSSQSPY